MAFLLSLCCRERAVGHPFCTLRLFYITLFLHEFPLANLLLILLTEPWKSMRLVIDYMKPYKDTGDRRLDYYSELRSLEYGKLCVADILAVFLYCEYSTSKYSYSKFLL
jgi:hypothetical protein